METLWGVILLALVWHVGLAVIEYNRRPRAERPSMARLLLLAEVEVLRSLHAELRRRSQGRERKLLEVEKRLRELKDDEERADL